MVVSLDFGGKSNMFQVVAKWRSCIVVVSLDFAGKSNMCQVVAKWRSCIMVVSLDFGAEKAACFKWLQNGDLALWWCPLILVLKKQRASSGCKMEILHYGGVP